MKQLDLAGLGACTELIRRYSTRPTPSARTRAERLERCVSSTTQELAARW